MFLSHMGTEWGSHFCLNILLKFNCAQACCRKYAKLQNTSPIRFPQEANEAHSIVTLNVTKILQDLATEKVSTIRKHSNASPSIYMIRIF